MVSMLSLDLIDKTKEPLACPYGGSSSRSPPGGCDLNTSPAFTHGTWPGIALKRKHGLPMDSPKEPMGCNTGGAMIKVGDPGSLTLVSRSYDILLSI